MAQVERRHDRLAVRLSLIISVWWLAKHWICKRWQLNLVCRFEPCAGTFGKD